MATPAASRAPAGLLVAAPSAEAPRVPLYKKWWFWTLAGGVFAGTVVTTYVVTRPPPTPYYGSIGTMMFQ